MLTAGTIGAFDLFHVGHLRFLQEARVQCDWLKVGIGADETCAQSKRRPIIDERQRMEVLSGLRCVDEVCLFSAGLDNTEASAEWIAAWGVQQLFVSEEWRQTPRWQRLSPRLAAHGIECIWLPYTPEISSTQIRQRLQPSVQASELLPAVQPLLPNEPRVRNLPQQSALTECYLLPALTELKALFLSIRARLDPQLRAAQPAKQGKPYPLGQCLEISLAVKRDLRTLQPASLHGAAAKGHAALATFLQYGGDMHQVWGDLRGEFFQNAFLAGTLYIDVANDTVVASKPPVEIQPLAVTDFQPVQNFGKPPAKSSSPREI